MALAWPSDLDRRADIHILVRTTRRNFLETIPRFLLEPCFWTEYLCCRPACSCSNVVVPSTQVLSQCERRVCTWFPLLLPRTDRSRERLLHRGGAPGSTKVTAAGVKDVKQLRTDHIYFGVDPRFHYVELRLCRLNEIYCLWQTPPRGYMLQGYRHSAFFQDHFAWLVGTTVYLIVVMIAMQVGHATESLNDNDASQSALYLLTIFSILAPIILWAILHGALPLEAPKFVS